MQYARKCSMDVDMQHGYVHAAWTWTCSMDMDMQHGHGHAAWTWSCNMDLVVQCGRGFPNNSLKKTCPNKTCRVTTRPMTSCPTTARPMDSLSHWQLPPWTARAMDSLPQSTARPMDKSPLGQLAHGWLLGQKTSLFYIDVKLFYCVSNTKKITQILIILRSASNFHRWLYLPHTRSTKNSNTFSIFFYQCLRLLRLLGHDDGKIHFLNHYFYMKLTHFPLMIVEAIDMWTHTVQKNRGNSTLNFF